jgi:outer membrane protein assembly factor BamE (lipoprotein component of BamABCDE complex)
MPFFSLIVGLFLVGCSTSASHLNTVSVGMTKPQIIAAMGQPQSTRGNGENEYFIYQLRERMSRPDEPWPVHEIIAQYFVRFKNGVVDSYGKLGDFDSPHPR